MWDFGRATREEMRVEAIPEVKIIYARSFIGDDNAVALSRNWAFMTCMLTVVSRFMYFLLLQSSKTITLYFLTASKDESRVESRDTRRWLSIMPSVVLMRSDPQLSRSIGT